MAKTPIAAQRENHPDKLGEIIGIILVVTAVLIILALYSYNSNDESFHTATSPVKGFANFAGKAGSYSSSLLSSVFGSGAWAVPFILMYLSYFYFAGKDFKVKTYQFIGGFFLLLAICSLASTISTSMEGGVVGLALSNLLISILGQIGSYAVLVAFILIAAVVAIDFRVLKVTRAVNGIVFKILVGVREAWKRRPKRIFIPKPARDQKSSAAPVIRDPRAKPTKEKAIRQEEFSPKPEKTEPDFDPITVEPEAVPFENPDVFDEPDEEESFLEEKPRPAQEPTAIKLPQISPNIRDSKTSALPIEQLDLPALTENYVEPPLDLLEAYEGKTAIISNDVLVSKAKVLESKLGSFGIEGSVVEVQPGPVITMFEYEPASGVKVNKIYNLEDDLAMAMRAESIRIDAIPGKGTVGIEIPNQSRETVYLREILASHQFLENESVLAVAFGKDISGNPVVQDLTKMPHLLVAGTTGSGKSVFLNCIICSVLYKATPNHVRLLLVDPKMLELSCYSGIPHLLHPVVTDPKKAAVLLKWAVQEMAERYNRMAQLGVRSISGYNKKVEKMASSKSPPPKAGWSANQGNEDNAIPQPLPYILIIIDELADLMLIAQKDIEESIKRLAQMARAAGIHLILATQRPSVDVITGVIKVNFPARVAFKVAAKVDSKTILDTNGAEQLLGMGDMLFLPPTSSKLHRIHGAFVSDRELQDLVAFLRSSGKPIYDQTLVEAAEVAALDNEPGFGLGGLYDEDVEPELYDKAIEIVAEERKASISYLQRRLKIGYNRAARIIEKMEADGIVGKSDGTSRPREVYIGKIGPDRNELND